MENTSTCWLKDYNTRLTVEKHTSYVYPKLVHMKTNRAGSVRERAFWWRTNSQVCVVVCITTHFWLHWWAWVQSTRPGVPPLIRMWEIVHPKGQAPSSKHRESTAGAWEWHLRMLDERRIYLIDVLDHAVLLQLPMPIIGSEAFFPFTTTLLGSPSDAEPFHAATQVTLFAKLGFCNIRRYGWGSCVAPIQPPSLNLGGFAEICQLVSLPWSWVAKLSGHASMCRFVEEIS